MQVCERDAFTHDWKRMIGQEKDSRVAVLFSDMEGFWEGQTEDLQVGMAFYYQVKEFAYPAEIEDDGDDARWEEYWEEAVRQWKPDVIFASGQVSFLQQICRIRQEVLDAMPERKLPLFFFPWQDEDVRMLMKDLLWIRDGEGRTVYLRQGIWRDGDRMIWPAGHEAIRKQEAMKVWPAGHESVKKREVMKELAWWEQELGMAFHQDPSLRKRQLWEELAEPLWLCYQIPIWIGIYFSFLFLYRLLDQIQQDRMDRHYHVSGHVPADEVLEGIVERDQGYAVQAVWLPDQHVDKLVEMAMAGIEMLPDQWLSRQQVEMFYRSLCR